MIPHLTRFQFLIFSVLITQAGRCRVQFGRQETAQQANTAAKVGETDAPTYACVKRCKSCMWTATLPHRLIIMGQLFWHKKQDSHGPNLFAFFPLSQEHFLRSQRNSADYISSLATFQGVGGSHTWAAGEGQSTELGCLPSPSSRSSGPTPRSW